MDPMYFFTDGSDGSNITYSVATTVKRSVYISPGAIATVPAITDILHAIIEAFHPSKWTRLATEPAATSLSPTCLVLVSEEEKVNHVDWATCRYALPLPEFLSYVGKIDTSKTSSGLCGQ